MKFIPRPGRLYVVLNSVGERRVGSILLPDMHSEPTRIGTVRAAGPDVDGIAVGDRVLVSYYSGVVITMPELRDDENEGPDIHRIFTPEEILAIVVD